MSTINEQSVVLRHQSGAETRGVVRIEILEKRERLLRALRLAGLCWLLAIGAVFMPIVHFILVPLLLLAGPIIFFVQWPKTHLLLGGEGICPMCNMKLLIQKGAYRWPQEELCSGCRRNLDVNLVNA